MAKGDARSCSIYIDIYIRMDIYELQQLGRCFQSIFQRGQLDKSITSNEAIRTCMICAYSAVSGGVTNIILNRCAEYKVLI